MSTALAIVDGRGARQPDKLPDLALVEAQVRDAVAAQEKDVLTDAAKRAEAQALYEQRKGFLDRERHFARLRVMCEAGIAVIACDEQSEQSRGAQARRPRVGSHAWLVYAAAFERGRLLAELSEFSPPRRELGYSRFSSHLEVKGYYWVPGKTLGVSDAQPWWRARELARAASIPLADLPLDPREFAQRTSRGQGISAQQRARQRQAVTALSLPEKQKVIGAEAKKRSERLAEGYRHLRKTLATLNLVYGEPLGAAERRSLDDALRYLSAAEDSIGALLRVGKTTQ